MKPSTATENALIVDAPGSLLYEMKIIGRRDVNSDGIEDLEVCFVDRAQNGGTYHATQGLLITRYSETGYALALHFTQHNAACVDSAL